MFKAQRLLGFCRDTFPYSTTLVSVTTTETQGPHTMHAGGGTESGASSSQSQGTQQVQLEGLIQLAEVADRMLPAQKRAQEHQEPKQKKAKLGKAVTAPKAKQKPQAGGGELQAGGGGGTREAQSSMQCEFSVEKHNALMEFTLRTICEPQRRLEGRTERQKNHPGNRLNVKMLATELGVSPGDLSNSLRGICHKNIISYKLLRWITQSDHPIAQAACDWQPVIVVPDPIDATGLPRTLAGAEWFAPAQLCIERGTNPLTADTMHIVRLDKQQPHCELVCGWKFVRQTMSVQDLAQRLSATDQVVLYIRNRCNGLFARAIVLESKTNKTYGLGNLIKAITLKVPEKQPQLEGIMSRYVASAQSSGQQNVELQIRRNAVEELHKTVGSRVLYHAHHTLVTTRTIKFKLTGDSSQQEYTIDIHPDRYGELWLCAE